MKSVDVQTYLSQSTHPKPDILLALRDIIRAAAPDLHEHIKWNAPSYQAGGDDRITFNLSKPDAVKIILHRGATAKDTKTGVRLVADDTGWLIWASDQCAAVHFETMEQVSDRAKWLETLVPRWIAVALAADHHAGTV